jgi:hypothetical protein
VLLGANELEAMQEKIDLLSDVQTSLNQLAKGEGISHYDAKDRLLKRLPYPGYTDSGMPWPGKISAHQNLLWNLMPYY